MDPMDIHSAAKKGDLHRVRQLVEAGASMDSRDDDGCTPLLLAAVWGHHAVVEFLINCKLCHGNRKPPMLLDIDVEKDGAMGLFLQHDDENYTLLHFASMYGWADITQTIIEKGSESDMVNAATSHGFTPLILAVRHGREDVAALILRSGADVNRRDKCGFTALHSAARRGNVRLVKLFLQEEGLDLNAQDLNGQTPLHLACCSGDGHFFIDCEKVIKQLLAAGADANLINRFGETPLSICIKVQTHLYKGKNPSQEAIKLCVQHGAFFRDPDYGKISENPVLRENVLKNVDLCTQSVINKFSHQTLPAVYSSPYFASMLPSMGNLMLNTSQKEEVKNLVRRDIQQNTFCNVVRVRPTALSALCVQCLAAYTASRH